MMSLHTARRAVAVVVLLLLAACSSNEKAYLVEPRIGDLYAVDLTHFTEFSDAQGHRIDEGSGLLKVIKVESSQIVVVTTDWYNDSRRQVVKELRDANDQVQWDASDEIVIARAALPGLIDSGEIYAVKRPGT